MTESLSQARVLVTGATGFVGRQVCRKLVELGAVTSGLSRSAAPATLPAKVAPFAVDVTQPAAVNLAFEQARPTHVLHLAAAGVNDPRLAEAEATRVNVSGTLNVLRASRALHVQRFVHVGTCYEHLADESHANTYAASKLEGWRTWHAFLEDHSMEAAALRLFHVYGPEQSATGLIASAIRAALCGARFEMTPGEQLRDFVYITDVVEALLAALSAPLAGTKTYDVGTGVCYSVRSVVQRIFEKAGAGGEVAVGAKPYRTGEMMRLVADAQPAARDLGWQAQTNLETGLTMTLNWQRLHGTPR